MDRKSYFTDFSEENHDSFIPELTRIYYTHAHSRSRHLQSSHMLKHSTGHILATSRWDEGDGPGPVPKTEDGDYQYGELLQQSREGNETNEQALFFSRDSGISWEMGNYGRPILTYAQGSSFETRSSIVHALIYEDRQNKTWLYYTVNQPWTCGKNSPWKSTGGGEIRKIEIGYNGETWTTLGESVIVWGNMKPIAGPEGTLFYDCRIVSLNGIIRLSDNRLLMPVSGRNTISRPEGRYWRLNRCWVLISHDDGKVWKRSSFIGGSDELCLCEPTLVETKVKGHIAAYMRCQYNTGNQLYRSDSDDYGETWSEPFPAGLPNTNTSGTKPYVFSSADGRYFLLQTNEHQTDDRTNMTVFATDETGFSLNRWKTVKTICIECLEKWKGSCYGTGFFCDDNHLMLYFTSFDLKSCYLNFARVSMEWLNATVYEPNGISDIKGCHIPVLSSEIFESGNKSLMFENTRARAISTHLGNFGMLPYLIEGVFYAELLPEKESFDFFKLYSHNGRKLEMSVVYRPQANGHIWVWTMDGWTDMAMGAATGEWFGIQILYEEKKTTVKVDNSSLCVEHDEMSGRPDTLITGGNSGAGEKCRIFLDRIHYREGD